MDISLLEHFSKIMKVGQKDEWEINYVGGIITKSNQDKVLNLVVDLIFMTCADIK